MLDAIADGDAAQMVSPEKPSWKLLESLLHAAEVEGLLLLRLTLVQDGQQWRRHLLGVILRPRVGVSQTEIQGENIGKGRIPGKGPDFLNPREN